MLFIASCYVHLIELQQKYEGPAFVFRSATTFLFNRGQSMLLLAFYFSTATEETGVLAFIA